LIIMCISTMIIISCPCTNSLWSCGHHSLPHTPSSHVLLMSNSKHLTHGISNLVSLITKTKLGLSLLSWGRWSEGVERLTRGHASRSFSRWANEPRAGRSVVEVPRRTWRGRGVRVEGASYESEPERGRGAPSSRPRTRRTWHAVLRWAAFCCGLVILFFYYRLCGYPHTVVTDTLIPHLDATIKFRIVSTYTMSPENKFPLSNNYICSSAFD
jgi:hypothetical protein